MKIRDLRSIIVVLIYFIANGLVLIFSVTSKDSELAKENLAASLAPDYTIIENLEYFNLKAGGPVMSLSADEMKSQGEDIADFVQPRGVYNYKKNKDSVRYQGHHGQYLKQKDLLILTGEVKINSTDNDYFADRIDYFMMKDLVLGEGRVKFIGEDLKSKDKLTVESVSMNARPNHKLARFSGDVRGSMVRKKQYEGKTEFRSATLDLDGVQSLAQLQGDVWMKRGEHQITAGKADVYLENFNKSLKYFVLNDDVKVIEKLKTAQGITERKAYSERLEGFGREEKMILTGAPRVETGTDVIKGYRITIRENTDLVEVDDAMSDVNVKRKDEKKLKD